jgi:Flp pilus assembly protein TadD
MEFAHLSYTLAEIFKDTSEIGVAKDFLLSALYSGIDEIKPEARLDYVDVILKFGRWPDAIQNINAYEEYYGSNQRSRELRVMTHIGARQFDEADKELAGWQQNDPVTIKYRLVLTQAKIRQTRLAIAQKTNQHSRDIITGQQNSGFDSQSGDQQFMTRELENYSRLEAELVEKLLSMEPDYVDEDSFVSACRNSITQGDISRASRMVEQFLRYNPDNIAVKVYRQILSELKPDQVLEPRFREIEEQVLLSIVNSVDKAAKLGIFYRREGDVEKAAEYLNQALITGDARGYVPDSPEFEQMKIAADNLFEIALEKKDWESAEDVVKTAMRYNLDLCEGKIFSARLAFVRSEYKIALATVDESLKIRPLFSYAYLLRSNINAAIGDEHACLGDIRKAASISPLDGNIAKGLAIIFYQRNQTLGDNVTSTQISEVTDALERAIALNPGDLGLLGLYADYIAATEPMKAIAIRQDLLKAVPSVDNYILLGKLATEVARKDKDPTNKETLFSIAGSAFEQARKINPNDQRMLYYYANYFRALGQDEKAKSLLEGSKDEQLLWNHYFQSGKYESARKELEQQYNNGNRDIEVVEGLLLIAEKTGDKDNVKRYSEELLALEDNAENKLVQIQAFLKVGLVNEAQNKFQGFKEKYPDDSRILLLEAWLLMRQGQLDKALASTNKNLQNNPDNPAALRLRGEINFFRSDYAKAISDLNKSKLLSD